MAAAQDKVGQPAYDKNGVFDKSDARFLMCRYVSILVPVEALPDLSRCLWDGTTDPPILS